MNRVLRIFISYAIAYWIGWIRFKGCQARGGTGMLPVAKELPWVGRTMEMAT